MDAENNGDKLNIGIVCYPSIGGSGVVATLLGQHLASLGHLVHFISYDPPFKLDREKKNIFFHKVELSTYSLFKFPDYTLPLAVKIVEISEKFKLDILHVHYAVPHATAALLAKAIANEQKIKFPHVITTLHGTDITLLGRDKTLMPAIKYSIDVSCGVTAVSESLKKETQKVLGVTKEIEVLYNFYTPKQLTKTRAQIRGKLGVEENDFLLVHISNLRKVKRIPDLLEIISLLKEEKRIKLLILAGGDFSEYEGLVKEYGIEKQVIVENDVQDIENYINASDLGIYTSEEESFGLGILETMFYSKPVLATNIGGIPEVIKDGQTGFLFKLGDTQAFAEKIKELAGDNEKLKTLGENALAHAKAEFTTEKKVAAYLDFYRKVMRTCIGKY